MATDRELADLRIAIMAGTPGSILKLPAVVTRYELDQIVNAVRESDRQAREQYQQRYVLMAEGIY